MEYLNINWRESKNGYIEALVGGSYYSITQPDRLYVLCKDGVKLPYHFLSVQDAKDYVKNRIGS